MRRIAQSALFKFPRPFTLHLERRVLHFRRPAMTSRGALTERVTYIIEARTDKGSGYGECCTMPGLLPEPTEAELEHWCAEVQRRGGLQGIEAPSPIRFGLECALLAALKPGQPRWDTPFARGEEGLPIHHLIWMADADTMLAAMQRGIDAGFSCLKIKVGALPFAQELEMLRIAHSAFPQAEIRVDANGAFSPQEAPGKLAALAEVGVSSIEQPIRPHQWQALAALCRHTPLPIALDEELISCPAPEILLDSIAPQAIVIKPSLHGGLLAAEHWAELAEQRGISWWVNSALESHIGLTALAEWCAYAAPGRLQGLGTGRLFTDDEPYPILLRGANLFYTHRTAKPIL
ncbi:MAG: o-succinylbenzoate synthase [Akkermansia sp.]|nr:o-succinylbenzoate synthase [Akkermansia sp.]